MSTEPTLIFDIETVGADFDSLDQTTQDNLTRWIEKSTRSDEEYEAALADLKSGLGFSPLTGEIVAIGMMSLHDGKGAVYYQAPGQKNSEETLGDIVLKQLDEKEMLQKFWQAATKFTTFVTFNGRAFDAPFLAIRSAIHGVRPTKDLLRGRYLYQQSPVAVHIDLQDQLTFYGATPKKGSLHLFARAFGIESPKESGVTGDDVARLFKEKKYLDIARYNIGDLRATAALYRKWNDYLRFI